MSAGQPAERTALSWSRTTLALLGNGGLLLVRQPVGRSAGTVLAAAALLLAAAAAVFARRRARVLAGPRRELRPATLEVTVLGLGIGALAVAVGCAVVLT